MSERRAGDPCAPVLLREARARLLWSAHGHPGVLDPSRPPERLKKAAPQRRFRALTVRGERGSPS